MNDVLKVLQDSVIISLEDGAKGKVFPEFHQYIDGTNNVPAEKIPLLRNEAFKIYEAFVAGMSLTNEAVIVNVPIHETGYSSLSGIPTEKKSQEEIGNFLCSLLDQCELAISLECGFGNYSASQEKIEEASKTMRGKMEIFRMFYSKQFIEIKIVAFDSNNNLQRGRVVDGLWVPYTVIGLIRYDIEDITLGFMSTMDYGSGEWKINKLNTELIVEFVKGAGLFSDAYQKLTGISEYQPKLINLAIDTFIDTLKCSPQFLMTLKRICNRWVK